MVNSDHFWAMRIAKNVVVQCREKCTFLCNDSFSQNCTLTMDAPSHIVGGSISMHGETQIEQNEKFANFGSFFALYMGPSSTIRAQNTLTGHGGSLYLAIQDTIRLADKATLSSGTSTIITQNFVLEPHAIVEYWTTGDEDQISSDEQAQPLPQPHPQLQRHHSVFLADGGQFTVTDAQLYARQTAHVDVRGINENTANYTVRIVGSVIQLNSLALGLDGGLRRLQVERSDLRFFDTQLDLLHVAGLQVRANQSIDLQLTNLNGGSINLQCTDPSGTIDILGTAVISERDCFVSAGSEVRIYSWMGTNSKWSLEDSVTVRAPRITLDGIHLENSLLMAPRVALHAVDVLDIRCFNISVAPSRYDKKIDLFSENDLSITGCSNDIYRSQARSSVEANGLMWTSDGAFQAAGSMSVVARRNLLLHNVTCSANGANNGTDPIDGGTIILDYGEKQGEWDDVVYVANAGCSRQQLCGSPGAVLDKKRGALYITQNPPPSPLATRVPQPLDTLIGAHHPRTVVVSDSLVTVKDPLLEVQNLVLRNSAQLHFIQNNGTAPAQHTLRCGTFLFDSEQGHILVADGADLHIECTDRLYIVTKSITAKNVLITGAVDTVLCTTIAAIDGNFTVHSTTPLHTFGALDGGLYDVKNTLSIEAPSIGKLRGTMRAPKILMHIDTVHLFDAQFDTSATVTSARPTLHARQNVKMNPALHSVNAVQDATLISTVPIRHQGQDTTERNTCGAGGSLGTSGLPDCRHKMLPGVPVPQYILHDFDSTISGARGGSGWYGGAEPSFIGTAAGGFVRIAGTHWTFANGSSILANGESSSSFTGKGSGGHIIAKIQHIHGGTVLLAVNGGDDLGPCAGGGGAGMIKVSYGTMSSDDSIAYSMLGGAGCGGDVAGNHGAPYMFLCPAGSYTSDLRNITCIECPVGQYTDTTSATHCTLCPPGSTTKASGSTLCTAIPCFDSDGTSLEQQCTGRGRCRTPHNCTCTDGERWTGDQCQYSLCNGVRSDQPGVCSGYGVCNTSTALCECNDGKTLWFPLQEYSNDGAYFCEVQWTSFALFLIVVLPAGALCCTALFALCVLVPSIGGLLHITRLKRSHKRNTLIAEQLLKNDSLGRVDSDSDMNGWSLELGNMAHQHTIIPADQITVGRQMTTTGAQALLYVGTYQGAPCALKIYAKHALFLESGSNDNGSRDNSSLLDHLREFLREAEVLRLYGGHINIVRFFGVCDLGANKICLVEELCEGNLATYIAKKRKNGETKMMIHYRVKLQLLRDIAAGMAHLHSHGVMHRDLKLENVLYVTTASKNNIRAMLCDMGLSRKWNGSNSNKSNLTLNVGTAYCAAPEVLRQDNTPPSNRYSSAIDVYSYGIIIACLLGETSRPYGSLGDVDIMVGVTTRGLRPTIAQQHLQDLPVQMQHLVPLMRQCWQEDPALRPSFAEILSRLDNASNNGDFSDGHREQHN